MTWAVITQIVDRINAEQHYGVVTPTAVVASNVRMALAKSAGVWQIPMPLGWETCWD